MADLGSLVASLGLDIKDLKVNETKAENIIKSYSKKVDKELDTADRRFKKHSKQVDKIFKRVRGAIGSFTAGLAIYQGIRLFQNIVEDGKQFEKTMAAVKGITGGEQFKEMSELAKKMGANTEFTAQQAAEGLRFLTMAGISANESIKALPGILDLATAGNLDLGRSADIASNAMTAMGLQAQDLKRINDSFVNTITRSNSTVEMLAEAFKYVAPSAKAFGLDIETLNALLGKLHDAGIQGSMAGTQLNQALIKSAEYFAEIGKQGNIIDLLKHINKEAWSTTDVLDEFAGRGGRAIIVLRDMVPAIEDFVKEIKSGENATTDLADTMRDTTDGAIKELDSAIKGIKIDAFENNTSILKGTIKDLTKVVRENREEFIILADALLKLGTFTAKTAGVMSHLFTIYEKFVEKVDDLSFADKMKKDIADTEKEIVRLKRQQGFIKKAAISKRDKEVKLQIVDDLIREKQTTIGILQDQLKFYENVVKANKKVSDDKEQIVKKQEEENKALKEKSEELKKQEELYKKQQEEVKRLAKEEQKIIRKLTQIHLNEPTRIEDTGFDPYGDLVTGAAYGKKALEDMQKSEAKAQEFAQFIGDSTSEAIREGIINGVDSAMGMVGNIISNVLAQTVQKGISDQIGGIAGSVVGGVAGGLVAGIASSFLSSALSSGPSQTKIYEDQIKEQVKELKRNTEEIKRSTDFRKNEVSSYSSGLFNASENLMRVSESYADFMKSGGSQGDLDSVGYANAVIKSLEVTIDFESMFMDSDFINSRKVKADISKAQAEIENLQASIEEFATVISNIQLDITNSAKDLYEEAGDAFRTEAEIQKREFNKTSKNLLLGLADAYKFEGIFTQEDVNILNQFTNAGELAKSMLVALKGNQEQYNEVLETSMYLVAAAALQQKAYADTFNTGVADWQKQLSQRNWGIEDWELEFRRLGSEINILDKTSEDYFGEALDLAEQQFDVLQTISGLMEAQLDALKSTEVSLIDQIYGVSTSDTSSVGLSKQRYQELFSGALTLDPQAIAAFQSFVPDFIEVMSSAGYSRASVESGVKYDLNEVLSGVSTSISNLNTNLDTISSRAPSVSVDGTVTSGINAPISVQVVIDGREIASALIEQLDTNQELIDKVRRVA